MLFSSLLINIYQLQRRKEQPQSRDPYQDTLFKGSRLTSPTMNKLKPCVAGQTAKKRLFLPNVNNLHLIIKKHNISLNEGQATNCLLLVIFHVKVIQVRKTGLATT